MSAIFDKGIKITNSEDATAQKVTVQSADGTLGYQSNLTFEKLSTGLLTGGIITINADTTKYNVSVTTGLVSNFSNPNLPVFKTVNYAGITGKVSTYLATSNITYIGLDENGILLEQATPFTTSQDRDIISLGAVIHSNRTNINTVNNIGLPTVGASNQLHDLMEAIGALNLSGNKFSANGANLKLNKSAGVLFKLGSNAQNDWKNPHQIAQGATTALTFRYRTQTGAEGLDITDLDPSKYDLSGVLTTVPPNKYTVQTITLFQAGAVRIQYGQDIYNSLDEAEKAIATRSFVAESNIAQNGVNRGYVIMKHNTSSLQNASDAKLIEITKFGGLSSGGLALTFANITAALGYTPADIAGYTAKAITSSSSTNADYPIVFSESASGTPTYLHAVEGTDTLLYNPSTKTVKGKNAILTGSVVVPDATLSSQAVNKGQLDVKENASNKQNSLATDGTGVKFPTVDAVKSRFDNYTTQRSTISEIRVMSGDLRNNLFYTTDLGQEGNWYYDATDTTSVDNTGTVLVTADGKRIKRVFDYVSFEMFGAKGDGVVDDTASIQNALSFAGLNKVKIICPSKAVYITSGNAINTGVIIEGNGCIIKNTLNNTGVVISPSIGSDISVTSIGTGQFPATTGKTVSFITVASGASFSKGDVLFLNSTDMYIWDVTMRKAEIVIVSGVIGNNVYLTKILNDTYTTSISVKKMSNDVVSIKGITFTYSGNYLTETATNNRVSSLSVIGAINPIIECNFENDITSGLSFYSCLNPIAKVVCKNLRNELSKNYYGYGVVNYGACRGGNININANNCRHAFTTGAWATGSKDIKNGTCIDNTVTGIAQNSSSASWDTHAGAFNTNFINCVVQGNSTDSDRPDLNQAFAFQDRGFKTVIINPIILGASAGFYCGGVNIDYGVENSTNIYGGYSESKSNTTLFAGVSIPTKTGSNIYKVNFDGHRFFGYNFSTNTQPNNNKVLEIKNAVVDFKGISGFNPLDNTLGITFINTSFQNLTTMRLGAGNSIDFYNCSRNETTASLEPITVSTGSTLTIDKFFINAPSYGFSQLIRAVNGASNLNIGFVSALNFSPTTVFGNDGASGSFTVNDISRTPININAVLNGGNDLGGSNPLTIGTVNNAQVQVKVNNIANSFFRSSGVFTNNDNYFGNSSSLNYFGLQVGSSTSIAQWTRNTADSIAVARVRNLNASSTGDIFQFHGFSSVLAKVDYLGGFTAEKITSNGVIKLKNYTVATLPTGTQGDTAYVTDATAPTYLGVLVGGGAVKCPVFYNGTAWVSH